MEDLILVTGGAGFIGSNFILQWIASERARILNLDKLTYAGNLNNLRRVEADPRYRFEQGDIVDRDFVRQIAATRTAPRHRSLRRREPRGPLDPRPRRFRPHQRQRHIQSARRSASLLVGAFGSSIAHRSAFCMFLPMKSTDRSARMTRLSAKPLPTRPTARTRRPRRLPIIWSAPITILTGLPVLTTNCSNNYGPLPVSRKTDPAHDPECLRWQAAPGVWRRRKCSRLALRRRSLPRHSHRALPRPRRRNLQHRRTQRKKEPGDYRSHMRTARRTAAERSRQFRTASSSRSSKTAPATTAATRWTRVKSSAN